MKKPKGPVAIIIGSGVVSLGVINDLACDGIRVIHISPKHDDLALRSRWPQEKFVLDPADDQTEPLIGLLRSNSTRFGGACLIPTTDPMLRIVSKNLSQIGQEYVSPVMPWHQLRGIVNKGLLYETAVKTGIPTPKIRYGDDLADTGAWQDSLMFPVIVKPSETPKFFAQFGVKVLQANDVSQLQRHLAAVNRLELEVMVSEIIPGNQTDLKCYRCYIDQRGKVIAEMCSEKLRSHPPEFGVGIVQRTIPMHPTLREQGLDLLHNLNFTGFATVEFKYDSRDDQYKLMEINPRPAMVQRLFRRAGINFAKLTVDDLMGKPLEETYSYSPGVYAIHNSADLYHLRRHLKMGAHGLREYLTPYFARRKVLLVPPILDPVPFLYDVSKIIGSRLTRLLGRSATLA